MDRFTCRWEESHEKNPTSITSGDRWEESKVAEGQTAQRMLDTGAMLDTESYH